MFQRELITEALSCPTCNSALQEAQGALHCTQADCTEQGGFFAYGPRLVRVPDSDEKNRRAVMPWEGSLATF